MEVTAYCSTLFGKYLNAILKQAKIFNLIPYLAIILALQQSYGVDMKVEEMHQVRFTNSVNCV